MDGFTGSEGVIVLAATNRPDMLDAALLRPGPVRPPRVREPARRRRPRGDPRASHTRNVPLAPDVDLRSIASSTPGMVGADLKNLVNEAALTAARRNHEQVELADFTDALERIILGAERQIVISDDERERTAYHESGHALLGMLRPGADPVRKVSIVPRGRALGVTFQSPDADRYGYDVAYLRGRIVGALGGRAAEQVVYGDFTTGAESDLEQVTRIARMMVGRWGMSEKVGMVSVLPGPQDEPTAVPRPGPGRAVGGDAAADRLRGAPDRRGVLRRGDRDADGAPRPARVADAGAARARDARRGRRVRRRRRARAPGRRKSAAAATIAGQAPCGARPAPGANGGRRAARRCYGRRRGPAPRPGGSRPCRQSGSSIRTMSAA